MILVLSSNLVKTKYYCFELVTYCYSICEFFDIVVKVIIKNKLKIHL